MVKSEVNIKPKPKQDKMEEINSYLEDVKKNEAEEKIKVKE